MTYTEILNNASKIAYDIKKSEEAMVSYESNKKSYSLRIAWKIKMKNNQIKID